jgi:hypothetical protein
MAKKKSPDEPLREDPASQPHKGKRGKQEPLPGVIENVVTHPSIERAMKDLSAAMIEYAAAGKVCQDQRAKIETLMLDKKVPSYVAHGLFVTIEGEPHIRVKRLKDKEEEAA